MDTFSKSIDNLVKDLYTVHPYPRYPLLAQPRWTAGYNSSLPWIQNLYAGPLYRPLPHAEPINPIPKQQLFLAAGCGEILPAVLTPWLPRHTTCMGLDLSEQSLLRALWRQWQARPLARLVEWLQSPRTKSYLVRVFNEEKALQSLSSSGASRMVLANGDMMSFLGHCKPGVFDHMDAFGVIHHLSSPRSALEHMARALRPGGTLRLMVYNAKARGWIREIQRLLDLLGFDFRSAEDVALAKRLVHELGAANPRLAQHLAQMGSSTIQNNARFADTFLHPREARIGAKLWYEWFAERGFSVLGLFDRYGELDHLPNPLWNPPNQETLCRAIDHHGFEGNLEFYLVKSAKQSPATPHPPSRLSPLHGFKIFLKGPPPIWFSFPETKSLSTKDRLLIWQHFVSQLVNPSPAKPGPWAQLPLSATKRLARLGVVNPSLLSSGQRSDYGSPLSPLDGATPHTTQTPAYPESNIPPAIAKILHQQCSKAIADKFSEKALHVARLRVLRMLNLGFAPHDGRP